MYLKEIKIAGFKSFRDNVTMTFDKGIACLVGPNGSGKSNIIDAVRFVLGEQSSKSLRGDQGMTDLIFSGSQNSKALNVASVSLTFDNSDNYLKIPFKEISIKRRIYRTGENDYFINGEKVRLKDIIDLFLDSGIGKNAFSIVGQGEIAKILSNSSLDRRSIIEQAAGIAKYKERKIETTRKLIKVDDNLNRVKDILDELKLQLDPLKEQSINARKYTDLKEELENLEISLITENIYKDNNLLKYVSRGGLKLEKAIKEFNIDVKNLKALDIGSSTGGFCDCLIQNGIKKITAIDVGTNLLHENLKNNKIIDLHEQINFKDLESKYFLNIDIVTCDVSFISLKNIIAKLAKENIRCFFNKTSV